MSESTDQSPPGPSPESVLTLRALGPDLDQEAFGDLSRDVMSHLATQPEGALVILDLSRVSMMSSLCLGAVLCLRQQVVAVGGRIQICSCQPPVRDLFRITRLDALIDVTGGSTDPKNEPPAESSPSLVA